jgi:xanthine dehydrogenase YagT iron-sulfur-binding subunit
MPACPTACSEPWLAICSIGRVTIPEPSDPGADAPSPGSPAREADDTPTSSARRRFLIESSALTTGIAAAPYLSSGQAADRDASAGTLARPAAQRVTFEVNGMTRELTLDPRVTLLDALRDHLRLTGTKKGCDRGQCGACTVLVNGRRVNACLTLAVSLDGDRVTTVEGLARGDALHPVQQAFVEHDGFQCGYCTPGQICSAVALIDEARAGAVSAVTSDVRAPATLPLSDDEVRERMSGNLCRCGAYVNIVAAVQAAARERG